MAPREPAEESPKKRAASLERGRSSPQPGPQPGQSDGNPKPGPCVTPREITTLVTVRAENWPPAGMPPRERAKLQAQIVRDFEKTLETMKGPRSTTSQALAARAVAPPAPPAGTVT